MDDEQIEQELEEELEKGLKVYRDLSSIDVEDIKLSDKFRNSYQKSIEEDNIFKMFFDREFSQIEVEGLVTDFAGYLANQSGDNYKVDEGSDLYRVLKVDQEGNDLSDVNIDGFQVSWKVKEKSEKEAEQDYLSQVNIFPGIKQDIEICQQYLADRFNDSIQ